MLERRSTLAELAPGPADAALGLSDVPVAAAALIPGWDAEAESHAAEATAALGLTGVPQPGRACAGATSLAVQLAPNRYLALTSANAAAPTLTAAVAAGRWVDWRCARAWLRLSGEGSRGVLDAAAPIDLREPAFPGGAVAQTVLARVDILIHARRDAEAVPAFDLLVGRSFARHVAEYLTRAARQHGLSVRLASPA